MQTFVIQTSLQYFTLYFINFPCSAGVEIQPESANYHIEEMSVEKIGKITFSRSERLGKGQFGWCVFKGKYGKDLIDVAVKRLVKDESMVDSSLHCKAEFFCLKKRDIEFK